MAFGAVRREVCLAYTPEARVGDFLIVHVGFAIQILDEAAAREALGYWLEIGLEIGLEMAEQEGGEP